MALGRGWCRLSAPRARVFFPCMLCICTNGYPQSYPLSYPLLSTCNNSILNVIHRVIHRVIHMYIFDIQCAPETCSAPVAVRVIHTYQRKMLFFVWWGVLLILDPPWCAFVSLWLGGLVCGSCVICGFRASFVWLRLVVMRSRSTLCEVPLEDIWRRPVPSSKAGRGEVCSV